MLLLVTAKATEAGNFYPIVNVSSGQDGTLVHSGNITFLMGMLVLLIMYSVQKVQQITALQLHWMFLSFHWELHL